MRHQTKGMNLWIGLRVPRDWVWVRYSNFIPVVFSELLLIMLFLDREARTRTRVQILSLLIWSDQPAGRIITVITVVERLSDILLYIDFWFLQSQFYWLTGKTISSSLVLKKPGSLFSIFVRNLLNLLHSSPKNSAVNLNHVTGMSFITTQNTTFFKENVSWIENGSMGYVCFQSIDRTINNFIDVSLLPTDYKWPANWKHPDINHTHKLRLENTKNIG